MDRAVSLRAARTGWALCLALVAGFVLLRLPYAVWPIETHPDERYYAVGAAEMIASGEWVVPVSPEGEVRLRKPPLPYWYAAAGFALFGETALGARAAWLATAAATLALTWALARTIGASVTGAALAVAALGGHATFAKSAGQHIPDGPLILGVTVALAAFSALYARAAERPAWLLYAGYLGLSWAALAKGLLPLLFLGVLLAVRLAHPLRLSARERRHERQAAALAAAACLWWFAVVALRFPQEMAAQFLADQVSDKATLDPLAVLAGLRKTVTDLALPFAPVLVAVFAARRWPPLGAGGSGAVKLLMAWVAAVVLLFAFSDPLWERYVLPAVPAAAALIGLWASRLEPASLARRLSRAAPLFALLPVVAALLAGVLSIGVGRVTGGLALIGCGFGLALLGWRVAGAGRAVPAAALLGATYPLIALCLVPLWLWIARPTPADILAADLARSAVGPADVVFLADRHLVNEIGLVTGGIAAYSFAPTPDALPGDAALVVARDPALAPALEAQGYATEMIPGFPFDAPDLGLFLAAWRAGTLETYRAGHGQPLVVGRRAARPTASGPQGSP
ncbi:phospholipid carrier-dependent glycosyltransferase [Rhodovulum sp. 12E13]|uniref:ArnT family glycosyltransferase n=1 Tax=Rhodovulum sp. 12E13 TaxID=2203891 RepID=UPI000E18B6DF|nr:phospholipid carrier-dependent glycosyltransferase [Rhodovulum sp. 12E13]RDC71590.1 phospholipid carrier-dependent glycosyltransferase [Rhodovulum sp. 12E13]